MIRVVLIFLSSLAFCEASFDRNSVGVVTDSLTKLQWQDDAIGTKASWKMAIDRCEALTLGGYSDWRLPNKNELISIVDTSKSNPSISKAFINTKSNYYWSSTTSIFANDTNRAHHVVFYGGTTDNLSKSNQLYVRCVRGGF